MSDLFHKRVEAVRKLGNCYGSNEKRRKWVVEVRAHVIYLRDLSLKHGLYEDLYTHALVKEVLESLPEEFLRKFEKKVNAIEGRVPRREMFEMMLEYLDTLVTALNKTLSFKLDYGVDNEKHSKPKFEPKKPAPPPSPKPSAKTKTYTASAAPSAVSASVSSGKTTKPQPKSNKGVYVYKSYVPPVMKMCSLCQGQNTHAFYCEKFYEADISGERLDIAKKLLTCFRCLRMDAEIDTNKRLEWEAHHDVQCQSEWVC